MKNFFLLFKAILYSNVKIGNAKKTRIKLIFSVVLSFISYIGFGIIYSLYAYSTIKVFNSEGYNYISNNYLDNIFAVAILISICMLSILVFNYTLYEKNEKFLTYPLKGNHLFFAKLLVGSLPFSSIFFFSLIMNSFTSSIIDYDLGFYNYISSSVISISEIFFFLFVISFIFLFIESKLHLSTNKIFSIMFMGVLAILAFLVFFYFLYTSSTYSSPENINRQLSIFAFLAPFGFLHKECLLLTNSISYLFMPLSLIVDFALFLLLNIYTKKVYPRILSYNNKKISFRHNKEDKTNKDSIYLHLTKKNRFLELKRELKLLSPLFVFSILVSFISLVSLFITIFLATSNNINNFLPYNLKIYLSGYLLLSQIYYPYVVFNSYGFERDNIFMIMSFPSKKINIFLNKFIAINILYLPLVIFFSILISIIFKLDLAFYFVYLFLAVSYLFSVNALNYLFGLIKPNLNVKKGDMLNQTPMLLLVEFLNLIYPAFYLIIGVFLLLNENLLLYIGVISACFYLLLGFLFLYFAKNHYNDLLRGNKDL